MPGIGTVVDPALGFPDIAVDQARSEITTTRSNLGSQMTTLPGNVPTDGTIPLIVIDHLNVIGYHLE